MTELITQLEAIVGSANVLNPEQVAQRAKHFWDPSPMVALALVGLIKKQYLKYSRTPEEIRIMQLLKKSLDPHNLLNPGKVC